MIPVSATATVLGLAALGLAAWTWNWGARLGWVYAWVCRGVGLATAGRLPWWSFEG